MCYFCCFEQKTSYEMRISDWSSDVCSSDLMKGFAKQFFKSHTHGLFRRKIPVEALLRWTPVRTKIVIVYLLVSGTNYKKYAEIGKCSRSEERREGKECV